MKNIETSEPTESVLTPNTEMTTVSQKAKKSNKRKYNKAKAKKAVEQTEVAEESTVVLEEANTTYITPVVYATKKENMFIRFWNWLNK
jgi:hypothetical protein